MSIVGRFVAVLLLSMMLLVVRGGSVAAAVPTPITDCPTADTLIELADPAGAVALIESLRKAEPRVAGVTPACASAYAEAARHQALAASWMAWVAELEDRADQARSDNEDVVVTPAAPSGCLADDDLPDRVRLNDPDELDSLVAGGVARALACDAANAAAVTRQAVLDKPAPSAAQAAEKSWTTYFTSHVKPWVNLFGVLLGWLAVGLVAARVSRWLLRNRVPRLMPRATGLQQALRVSGWVALFLGASAGIGLS